MYHLELQKNTIERSYDYMFGTNLLAGLARLHTFYQQVDRQLFVSSYTKEYAFNALYVLRLQQAESTVKSSLVPQNLVGILSILGGFLAMLTRLTGFVLRSYQRFTFRKSGIKKLYYYSRTKQKEHDDGAGPKGIPTASHLSD